MRISQSTVRNRLLRALSPETFAAIEPKLEPVGIPLRMTLVEPGKPTPFLYFVESGLASVVATIVEGEEIEVGLIGFEGMSGSHTLLEVETTPNRTFIQIAGTALRIEAPDLAAALRSDASARRMFLGYVHAGQVQMSSSALANGRFDIHHRLARWLLMSQDRLDGNDIPLTHEFLSLMLGVRRSGVTSEIHMLEGMGVIHATRALIKVLNRSRLEEIADGSYGVPEREYERLIKDGTAPSP